MLLEHLVYNIAIAIMIYTIYRKKEVLYIIIGSSYAPDIDLIADYILKKIGIVVLIYGRAIDHGDFHNILVMIIYATLVMLILNVARIGMIIPFILANIGFGLHMIEDALVFKIGYRFFWPLSEKIYGIGLLDYNGNRDFYGVANTEVLIVGLILIILALIIKDIFDTSFKTDTVINGR